MKLLLLAAALLGTAFANDSYVVVTPAKLRPGMDFTVSVHVLKASGAVTVNATMVRANDRSRVATTVKQVQQGVPNTIDLQLPAELRSGAYELWVEGSGGATWKNHTRLAFASKDKSVLVQTDKAMYKPGQTVNFRVLAMYPNMTIYRGDMNVEIYDANSNKIKQWRNMSTPTGVLTLNLSLSDQPVLGQWKIRAQAGNTADQKSFTIAEYVLPKFEVTVELPSYVLDSAPSVPVTVRAKYTYGKPVAGSVHVRANLTRHYYNSKLPSVLREGKLDAQGKTVIEFPLSELQSLGASLSGRKLQFWANVTETLTGVTQKGDSSVQVYNRGVKLDFPANNPDSFKPGLVYNGYLKVSQPDGLPLALTSAPGQTVTLKTTVTAELKTTTTPSFYYTPRTESYDLPHQTLTLNDNGLLPLALDIPANATRINIRAEYQHVTAYSNVKKSYSPSDSYMQLFLRSTAKLQAGGNVDFEFVATEPVQTLVYQVMSRGSIVAAGKVEAGGKQRHPFSLPVKSNMAPDARIVLYYVRNDGEIVTDSISFDVDGVFKNKVSVSLNQTEAQPAQTVQVTVKADPQSTAYLLALDQSVLLLGDGNDITEDEIVSELKEYDTTGSKHNDNVDFGFGGIGGGGPIRPPMEPVPFGGIAPRNAQRRRFRRMAWWPYPVYYGGSDATQIFQNAGVKVMTDALLYKYVEPFQPWIYPMAAIRPEMAFGAVGGMPVSANSMAAGSAQGGGAHAPSGPVQEVEHVRSVFPETWLWSQSLISADGTAHVTTTVPDTITSWVTSAFAVHKDSGLGIAPTQAKLRVFRPFFVTLNLPYSVVRGEQVVIQAIVFNYMNTDQNVRVSMAQSQDFFNLVTSANGQEDLRHEDQVHNVQVKAGEGKSVYFPIVPAKLGHVEVVVSAQSANAADAVRRQLLVEAEGVPKEFGVSVLVDLKDQRKFNQTVSVSLPPNVVADSARARVTAVGDLMGPTVNGLDKLLKMPTGCGEQTMLGMAPDVFVSSYLKATNQLSGDVAEKAVRYMEHGYQRELTYQHKDGSFSAFGDRDPSGSMWLTAFVAKTFHQAKPYIFVDDDVITRGLDWMMARQHKDGSFPEPGRVIHKNMQGGAGNGTSLTAYVLISMLENSDMEGSIHQRIRTSSMKAVSYLKSQLNERTDNYTLAMAAYALTLANDPDAATYFTRLQERAVVNAGLRYWHKPTVKSASTHTYWRPPTAKSSDVEMTSYALMTYAVRNAFVEGLDVMKWVASQRNPNGGFASTQDTVLALQALSEFARLAYSSNFNMNIQVKSPQPHFAKSFAVNQNNALVLQSADMPSVPKEVYVTATGSGIALVEVGVFFNVEAEVEEPTFEVKVDLVRDELNLLEIMTCAKWLDAGASGMAVQELGLPSGFSADLDSMKTHPFLKRTELQDRKVILYFDEIGRTPVCVTVRAERTGLVAKSKPVGVRVYDYYEPENQVTAFYESTALKQASVCDVCKECACPGRTRQ